MNGRQRIEAAFRGEWSDTTPVMLHNFMMAAREAGVTMRQFRTDPEAIARAFLEAVERYGYDGIVVDVDTATLAGAAGVPVDFPDDEPARVSGHRLADLHAVSDLPPVHINGYPGIQVWLEAVRLLVKRAGRDILIRGNCDQCPFTLASLVRGIDHWMMDLLDEEDEQDIHRLLAYCTEITEQFILLMAGAGAHMLSNGDSVASPDLLAPRMYRRYALPYARRIVDVAHRMKLDYILHICGNTTPIIDDMLATGADGLELDFKTDVDRAHSRMKQHAVFVGNLDPSGILALGTPDVVEQATRRLIELFSDTPGFILNAGCALPATTPPENLHAMIRTARLARR